jgi:hypothetical protein
LRGNLGLLKELLEQTEQLRGERPAQRLADHATVSFLAYNQSEVSHSCEVSAKPTPTALPDQREISHATGLFSWDSLSN